MRRLHGLLAGLVLGVPAAAVASDWVDYATVSMTDTITPKLSARYACYTDGTDIACNSPSIYVGTNGNVGIGNLNPSATLEVVGTISASSAVQVGDSTLNCSTPINGAIKYASGSLYYCTGTMWTALGNAGATTATSSTGAVQFNSGGALAGDTANFFWDDANNWLGIGTASPGGPLSVSGTGQIRSGGSTPRITFEPANYGTLNLWNIDNYNGDMRFFTEAYAATGVPGGGTVRMVIVSSTGNVGVGNSAPSAKLEVAGNVSVTGVIDVGHSALACSTTISGSIRYETTSDTLQVCTSAGWKSLASSTIAAGGGSLTGIGSATAVAYWNSASGLTYDADGFYWDANKNTLGIGINNPIGALHIVSTSFLGAQIKLERLGSSVSASFNMGAGSAGALAFNYFNAAGAENNLVYMGVPGNTGGFATLQISGSFTVSTSGQTTTPSLAVTSAGVGIGATPGAVSLTVAANTGNGSPSFGGGNSLLRLQGSASNYSEPMLEFAEQSNQPIASIAAKNRNSGAGDLIFLTRRTTTSNTEKMRIDWDGNVGISTPAPKARLDVDGNVSVTGIIDIGHTALACSATISGSVRFEATSDTLQVCTGSGWKSLASSTVVAAAGMAASSTGAIQFNSGGNFAGDTANLFWDDANNRLGIGTSNPAAALDVSGTAGNVQVTLDGAHLLLTRPSVNYIKASSAGGALSFAVNGNTDTNPSLFINSNGQVGISTNTPAAALDVASATTALQLRAGNTSVASTSTQILMGYAGGVSYSHAIKTRHHSLISATNAIDFYVWTPSDTANAQPSTRVMTLDGTGNVGIGGSVTPSTNLQIGTEYIPTSSEIMFATGGAGGRRAWSVGTRYGATTANPNFDFVIADRGGSAANDAIRMLIDWSTGYVGIGTQSPSTELDVNGVVSATILRAFSAVSGDEILRYETDNYPLIQQISDRGALKIASRDDSLYLGNGDVAHTVSETYFNPVNEDIVMASDGSIYMFPGLQNGWGTQSPSVFTSSGRLGVGNLAPLANLGVSGTISSTNAIQVGSSSLPCSAGIPGAIRYNAGSLEYCNGSVWADLVSGTAGNVNGTGAANHIAYWSGASTLTYDASQLYWDATNNRLGIGTNAPTEALTVAGKISATGEIVGNTLGGGHGQFRAVASNSASPSVIFRNDGGNFYLLLTANSDPYGSWNTLRPFMVNLTTGDVVMAANRFAVSHSSGQVSATNYLASPNDSAAAPSYSWGGDTNTGIFHASGDTIGFSTNGTEAMRIDATNRVGINTSTPQVQLEVSSTGEALRIGKQGGGTNPYFSWYNDGTRQAYMGYGTKNTDFDITTENGTRLDITGANGIALTTTAGEITANDRLAMAAQARMTGGTSNSIAWGTAGVAVPGAGSAGMKLHLYGSNPNTMAASDYGLGVESSNLWINTGGGIKLYSGSTLRAEMASTGTISATAFHASNGDSAAAPGFTWIGDTNTGFYHPAADTLGASIGGTERLRLYGGNLGLGLNGANPSYGLHVSSSTVYQNSTGSAWSYIVANLSGSANVSNSSAGISMYPGAAGAVETRWYTEPYGGDSYWRWYAYASSHATAAYRGDIFLNNYTNGAAQTYMYFDGPTGEIGVGAGNLSGRELYITDAYGDSTSDTVVAIDGATADAGDAEIQFLENTAVRWYIEADAGTDRLYVKDLDNDQGVYIAQDATAWTANSDRRLKTNVRDYAVLDKIDNGFRAVTFDWKKDGKRDFGVVAQEIYQAFPEVVDKGADDVDKEISDTTDKSVWGVKYDRIGVLALEGVKELNAKLQAENAALRTELKAANDNYDTRLRALERRLMAD